LKEAKATVLPAGWVTTEEVIKTLGIAQRTVQNWAKAGRLHFKMHTLPGRRAQRVYNSEDVERLKKEGPPRTPSGEVAPKAAAAPKRGSQTIEALEVFKLLVDEFRAQRAEEAAERERDHAAAWLTLSEAAAYLRLPKTYLHRAIIEERLLAVKAGGWRIRRKSLDEFQPEVLSGSRDRASAARA
jgi:excisionase family DNA binding protein